WIAPKPPARNRIHVESLLRLVEMPIEPGPLLRQLPGRGRIKQSVEQDALVREQARVGFLQLIELPVDDGTEFVWNLFDRQVSAAREIDDCRGHVERVRSLVEEQSHLSGTNVVRWCELHHDRIGREGSHALLIVRLREE